jgi:DNA-binding LacI/PurR family transcriptional regulator
MYMNLLDIMRGLYNSWISLAKELPGRAKLQTLMIFAIVRCAISSNKKFRQDFKRRSLPLVAFWDQKRSLRERSIDSNNQRAGFQTEKEEDMMILSHRRKIEMVGCCLEDG